MNKTYLYIAALLVILVSCTKRDIVKVPVNFQVATDKPTYKVGDTVRFLFSGDVENIVLWSGKPGSEYQHRDRLFVEGNKLLLNFKSFSQLGIVDKTNIKLLVSTNFNGIYDSNNISAATWHDITNRAAWSSGEDQAPSGEIDLSDFASENKDMVIAFRYVTTQILGDNQNRWVIRSFDLINQSPDGAITTIATMATAGWKEWSFLGSTKWSISTAQLIANRSLTELNDDYVITKLFNPNKVNPDRGIAVQNISNDIKEYSVVYDKPGNYKVTVVGTNASYKNQETIIRELDLEVLP